MHVNVEWGLAFSVGGDEPNAMVTDLVPLWSPPKLCAFSIETRARRNPFRQLLIVETYIDQRMGEDYPAMVCYPGTELGNDATNWWGPNASCVEAMLNTVGFPKVETVSADDDKPSLTSRRHKLGRLLQPGRKGTRVAFHARR